MNQTKANDNRSELLELQKRSLQQSVEAKEIVLKHLAKKIQNGDSATVAAMAEILKG